uniref:Vegetative incompatibility protein HET-E-1-like n=1 Tax=Rhizophora mucronata TaxID=61149 RepID=A0A2P2KCA7_RHIMU
MITKNEKKNLVQESPPAMADPSPSPSPKPTNSSSSKTTIMDLSEDSLAHCAAYLSPRDLTNLALSCKSLKRAAYCDFIWHRCFRAHWPEQAIQSLSQASGGAREAYLARRAAVQQFKFVDPLAADFYTIAKSIDHVVLDKNDIFFSQGSLIQTMKINRFLGGKDFVTTLSDHNARITCMRLFSLNETSFLRSETQRKENFLATSSSDHSIRLWWKGSCQRCFRGHNGPVSTLSDKLLSDGASASKVLASGGEDGTVRLWSLGSGGKRGQHALKSTLYGHEKPIKLVSVAGYDLAAFQTMKADGVHHLAHHICKSFTSLIS